MVLVDTNVLIDVLQGDQVWSDWSIEQLHAQSQVDELAINPIIYAELSVSYSTLDALNQAVAKMELLFVEIPKAALYLAGRAFLRYRREGGVRSSVLPDFFIGAHAAVTQARLMTRDAQRYTSYFPTVSLITPTPTH